MTNIIEVRIRAADETGPVYDAAKLRAAEEGRNASAAYSSGFATQIRGAAGEDMGAAIADSFADSGVQDVIGPDSEAGRKIDDDARKTGEQAGKDMGNGMSPLLVTALMGGLAVGAPLILGAFGGVMVGAAALALKSNVVIKNDFTNLGKVAETAITQAASPLAGTMHQALLGVSSQVASLTPQLQGLFVNAEPDITAVSGGVEAFASGILPGMSQAIKGSQVIVSDFGSSLGPLGQGVGGFFQGLTRDAATTGAGLESFIGVVGHLASTLGTVLGSAATAGSTALMGLDPVLNGVLTVVQKIANPATAGAAAGLFGAMKLDPAISAGLSKAADGVSTLAVKTLEAGGGASKMASALEGTSNALEKGAGIMAGPWGNAIGAGVGLVAGLVGSLFNAQHASDALTLSQENLQQSVSQDGGAFGGATAAYVAASAQADGLAASAQKAGVSLQVWTQAVAGSASAQAQVTSAVEKLNQAQLDQAETTTANQMVTGKYAEEQQDAQSAALGSAAASDKLTTANQQLLNSMHAQTQQVADAITKQAQLQQATNTLTNSTNIFEASLSAAYQQQVTSAQQTSLTTVAALNQGVANTTLSQKLDATATAYSVAAAGAQAYSTVLQALNGTTMSMDQAQNTLDQQMNSAKTSFAQNKDSLNQSTAAGVANRQALVAAAQAISALGAAEYQQTGSIDQSNKLMQDQEAAFIKATGATGQAKTAIEQYIDSLLQIPKVETTTLWVNQYTNKSSGEVGTPGGSKDKAYATGGVVSAAATGGNRGGLVQIDEAGTEMVRLQNGSTVIPHSNVESMAAVGSGGVTVQLAPISGGASPLEDYLWNWFKGRIRIVGGAGTNSVQRALGQVS